MSKVLQDGKGNVMAKITCPRCGIESEDWIPEPTRHPSIQPRIRRTCDKCMLARMGPSMRAAWQRLHPEE